MCLALLTSVSRALAHVRCLVPRANKGNNVSGGRTATIYTSTKCKKIKYIYFFGGLKYKHTARLKSLFRSRRWTAIARL